METQRQKIARLLILAKAAMADGRYTQALSATMQAIYLAPTDAALLALRAEAHLHLCDLQSAIANLRKAHRIHAANAETALRNLASLQESGEPPVAGASASGETSAAAEAQLAIRLAQVLDLRAVSLIEDGAHSEAAALLTEAIELDGSQRALWLHRALARTGLEQFDVALEDLKCCAAMDATDADVQFLRAKLSLLAGDLEGAHRAAQAALEASPGHAEALELGQTMADCAEVYKDEATNLILLGSPADAVSNLTHAMALRPNDPSLLMRRGAARRQQGALVEATRDMEAAIRQAGGKYAECERLLVLTFNDLGVKLGAQRRYADALGWLDRAIAFDPTLAACYLNRGDCYRAIGDVNAALADFEKAAELYSGDTKAQWGIQSRIALVHNERGAQLFNHAAARHAAVEFSRAIECNPRVSHFYINRARATLELERYDLARDDVLAALRLDPHDESAHQMLASLSPGA